MLSDPSLIDSIFSDKTRDLPTKTKKLTVKDLQHTLKSKNEILQRNLKKLELIKKICTIDLSSEVTSQVST